MGTLKQAYDAGHLDGYAGFAPACGHACYSEHSARQLAYETGYKCGQRDRAMEAPGWTLDIEMPAWYDRRAEEE